MTAPTDGVYRIATALDLSMNMDIANGSNADTANVQLYGDNDTPAQKVLVFTPTGSAYQMLRFANSGKVADIANGNAANDTNIQQYHEQTDADSRKAQEWVISSESDTVSLNGETLATYSIAARKNTGLVADCANGSSARNTNIRIHTDNDTLAQRWVMVKDSYPSSFLPAPALVGVSTASTGDRETTVAVTNGGTVYPCWTCAGSAFQVRYRYRTRAVGTDTWSDWGNWLSMSSETETNSDNGWGNAWDKNVTAAASDDVKHAWAVSVPFDLTSYDKREMQLQVRSWDDADYATYYPGAHGNSATETVTIAYRPELTFDNDHITLTPYGLLISYASDFPRGNNTFTLEELKVDGKVICEGFTAQGVWYTGDLLIPLSELRFVPQENKGFSAKVTYATEDTEVSQTITGTVSYSADSGLDFTVAQAPAGYNVQVSVTSTSTIDETVCVIVYEDDGVTRVAQCDGLTVMPPFGKDYDLIVSAVSGSDWAVKSASGLRVSSDACVWDFADGQAVMDMFKERYGGLETSYSRDNETYHLEGRSYESTYFGSASSAVTNISGVAASSALGSFHQLRESGYAIFRTPLGDRHEVAVTDVIVSPYADDLFDVKVTMREQSWTG